MKSQTLFQLVFWLAAPASTGLLTAAPANGIGGPVSGFVLDGRSHTLRPINGLPGGATLGGPVTLPFAAGMAAVVTSLDYAIVSDMHGTGEPYVARGLASGAATVTLLTGGIAASRTVLAASGTAAVLYSQPGARLQFVSGLPAQPVAGGPVDLSSLHGDVSALAVDASGRIAVLIAGDGIYWAAAGEQGVHFVVSASGFSSASVLPNGQDAVVGSRDTGDVLLIRGFAGAATVSTLTGAGAGIASATAVQALSDHEAGIVDAAGRLAVVDLDTSSLSWIGLAGRADRIEPVDRSLLLLNRPGSGALLLLDLTNGRTTYFVPSESATDLEPHKGNHLWKH
jgi:hypothetical protein